MYIASSFVVLALLAMGITIVSNYDKMKQMEVSINRLEVTADGTTGDYVDAMATTELPLATGNDVVPEITDGTTQTAGRTTEEPVTSELAPEMEASDPATTADPGTVNTTETISDVVNEDYYIIQEGDSLSSIAFTRYGDADLAAKIAEKNGIGVDDNIFVGQKILLPNIP